MPIQEFWADSREYFEFQRCGGSMTHLNRILGGEYSNASTNNKVCTGLKST